MSAPCALTRARLIAAACTILLLSVQLHTAQYVVNPGELISSKIGLLHPGDTLLIKAGTYNESVTISGLNGTAANPITITGEAGTKVYATGQDAFLFYGGGGSSYITLENMDVGYGTRAGVLIGQSSSHVTVNNVVSHNNGVWGIQTSLSDYITVENCNLYGSAAQHGLYFSTTDHPVAIGNIIHDNYGCGIELNGDASEGGDGMISYGIIEGNTIYSNGNGGGGAGINMDGVEKTIVENNLIYKNGAGGITCYHDDGARTGAGNQFLNNTVYFNLAAGRSSLQISGGADNTTIRNNVFVSGKTGGTEPALEVDKASLSNLHSDYNIFYQLDGTNPIQGTSGNGTLTLTQWQAATGGDSHSLVVDPRFMSVTGNNYRLRWTSAGIDRGTTLANVPEDIVAQGRPAGDAYDIGAYERPPANVAIPPEALAVYSVEHSVAWSGDASGNGVFGTAIIEGGAFKDVHADPQWSADHLTLRVFDHVAPELDKLLYLLVYFDWSQDPDNASLRPTVKGPLGGFATLLDEQWSDDNGAVLYTFDFGGQPGYEDITFADTKFYSLDGYVADFEVATQSVPEPSMIATMALSVTTIVFLRRRRQR